SSRNWRRWGRRLKGSTSGKVLRKPETIEARIKSKSRWTFSALVANRFIPGDHLLAKTLGDFAVGAGQILRFRRVRCDIEKLRFCTVAVDKKFPLTLAYS